MSPKLTQDAALKVARTSPRVGRLLATTIVAAARIELRVTVGQAEAAALAHDYLPTDAIEHIRKNIEHQRLRDLPSEDRIRGGVSSTIIDGVTRTSERELRALGERVETGGGTWVNRLFIRFRGWQAKREIAADLHDNVSRRERSAQVAVQQASSNRGLVDDLTRHFDYGAECLQCRENYARRLTEIGLSERTLVEALATLDSVIDYHLDLVVRR